MRGTHDSWPRAKRALRLLALVALAAAASSPRAHEPDAEEVALGSLVDAELAFARMSATDGIERAFVANFAPEGVALQPAPVRVREAWGNAPPADPRAVRLDWKPAQAGVAKSLDFGYTTGPYALSRATDPAAKRHGVFFSVWQRARDGRWEVLLDAGIATPGEVRFAALGAAPRVASTQRSAAHAPVRAAARVREKLLADERAGFRAGSEHLTPNGDARLLRADARWHRNGAPPLVSRAAVAREIAARMRGVEWMPEDAHVARSGDMAVTYGRYREIGRDAKVRDGWYAHLWLRGGDGVLRLAYDVALPGRPGE
jgi:ketosteroid isomerase-like protein